MAIGTWHPAGVREGNPFYQYAHWLDFEGSLERRWSRGVGLIIRFGYRKLLNPDEMKCEPEGCNAIGFTTDRAFVAVGFVWRFAGLWPDR